MEPMLRFVASLSLLLTLSGCYQAASDPFVLAPRSQASCWDSSRGKTVLGPSDDIQPTIEGEYTLSDLIELSLCKSPKTAKSWAEAKQAAANYGLSLANFYPDLDFETYYEACKRSGFSGHRHVKESEYRDWALNLKLNYLLFDFGTTSARSSSYYYLLTQANLLHNREIQSLIQRVAANYYDWSVQVKQVEASLESLHDASVAYDSAKKKHEVGVADLTDVLLTKNQVSIQLNQLLRDEQERNNRKAVLVEVIGVSSLSPLELSLPKMDFDPAPYMEEIHSSVEMAYQKSALP